MSESHVDAAVQARIQAARRRTEDMRRQRAELAAARRAGKAKAHAAKLRRLRGSDGNAGTGQPPTTAGQSPTVAKGVHSMDTPGQADDLSTTEVIRGDTPTVAEDRPSSAPVAQQATTGEGQP